MKKYRYGDPTKRPFFRKYGNLLYFVVTWNLFGYAMWKALGYIKKQEDPNWDEKSGDEKYQSMIGIGKKDSHSQHIRIVGLSSIEIDPQEQNKN